MPRLRGADPLALITRRAAGTTKLGEGTAADSVLAADICRRRAHLLLAQDRDDLFLVVLDRASQREGLLYS